MREARTVQDGHTHGEQLVYEALYRLARPYRADSRMITIGLRTLAPLVPISYNNCQANVRSLVRKLAVEEAPGAKHNDGRTYIVYGEQAILERRRAARLTHVIRSTRGAVLVNSGAPEL
jgi:hypothetical protein